VNERTLTGGSSSSTSTKVTLNRLNEKTRTMMKPTQNGGCPTVVPMCSSMGDPSTAEA